MKKRAKTRIGDTSARIAEPKPLMECGGCWRVYDPAEGARLADRARRRLRGYSRRLALSKMRRATGKIPMAPKSPQRPSAAGSPRFMARFRRPRCAAPIRNDALVVEAVGFQNFAGYVLGIVVMPWFLTLLVAETVGVGQSARRSKPRAGASVIGRDYRATAKSRIMRSSRRRNGIFIPPAPSSPPCSARGCPRRPRRRRSPGPPVCSTPACCIASKSWSRLVHEMALTQSLVELIEDDHCFVRMTTAFGGARIVDWLSGEQSPRIC